MRHEEEQRLLGGAVCEDHSGGSLDVEEHGSATRRTSEKLKRRTRRQISVESAYTAGIMRGVLASDLLRNRELLDPTGTITFGAGRDAELDTYAFSVPTRHIDGFVSHNWADSPLQKFVALLWVNNVRAAFIVSNVAALAWALVTYAGYLPTAVLDYGTGLINVLAWSSFVYSITFLLCLRGLHLAKPFVRDRLLFLDKACIHQKDPVQKAAGIAKLDEFLSISDRMYLLWSPTYFTRLWCNHECACYMEDKGVDSVDFIPLKQPLTIVVMLLCNTMAAGCFLYGLTLEKGIAGIFFAISAVTMSVPLCIIGYVIADFNRDRVVVDRMLDNFALESSACTCCGWNHINPSTGRAISCDRDFVHNKCEQRFGSVEAFNTHVRVDMKVRVQTLLGPPLTPMPFTTWSLCWWSYLYMGLDIALNSPDPRVRIANLIEISFIPVVTYACAILLNLISRCVGPERITSYRTLHLTLAMLYFVLFMGFWMVWDALVQNPETPVAAVVWAVIIVAVAIYGLRAQNHSSPRTSGVYSASLTYGSVHGQSL